MHFELDHPTLRLGLVYAGDVRVEASPAALLAELAAYEAALRAEPTLFPEQVRAAVREVLRKGGYKPTGRGKPASEFLLAQALGQGVPRINNLVDINNLASLRYALPISVFDADKLGPDLAVRFGRAGESYVFNSSGQSMELAGLPLVCRGMEREPVGNAVKDSMLCKVDQDTVHALFVVYGTRSLPSENLADCMAEISDLVRRHLDAKDVAGVFVPE